MDPSQVVQSPAVASADNEPSAPCIMVIFGASGDLTKRLLVPALYNLACDGLLSDNFAVLGTSTTAWNTDSFREQMSTEIKKFHTRKEFDAATWEKLVNRFYYVPGSFTEMPTFDALKAEVKRLDAQYKAGGNVLFYFAVAPRFFGTLCDNLHASGFKDGPGWKRIIVDHSSTSKPQEMAQPAVSPLGAAEVS